MTHELLDFYNLDPDENNQDSLRLAMMFREEMEEATRAYMEILQIAMDASEQKPEEVSLILQHAINAALLTGIRAYRNWIQTQGINVQVVEENSGKDIPGHFFHKNARWPL